MPSMDLSCSIAMTCMTENVRVLSKFHHTCRSICRIPELPYRLRDIRAPGSFLLYIPLVLSLCCQKIRENERRHSQLFLYPVSKQTLGHYVALGCAISPSFLAKGSPWRLPSALMSLKRM